jgi:hypothetical protein
MVRAGQTLYELRPPGNCEFVEIFFLVNKKNKLMKLIKIAPILVQLVWTEFQTRFQVPGPSLKFGPMFFYICVLY